MEAEIRRILAASLGLEAGALAGLPAGTPLMSGELGLDSFAGARLLAGILEELGVDVAAEDLNLDALESVATLSAFVSERTGMPQADPRSRRRRRRASRPGEPGAAG